MDCMPSTFASLLMSLSHSVPSGVSSLTFQKSMMLSLSSGRIRAEAVIAPPAGRSTR